MNRITLILLKHTATFTLSSRLLFILAIFLAYLAFYLYSVQAICIVLFTYVFLALFFVSNKILFAPERITHPRRRKAPATRVEKTTEVFYIVFTVVLIMFIPFTILLPFLGLIHEIYSIIMGIPAFFEVFLTVLFVVLFFINPFLLLLTIDILLLNNKLDNIFKGNND